MRLKRRIIVVAVFLMFILNISHVKAECHPHAREVVEQFFNFDFDGYRLDSRGHEAIWKITDDEGEPPEWPVAVTKNFKIISAEKLKRGCCIKVHFNIYGYISDSDNGLIFRHNPIIEEGSVIVKCIKNDCKISLNSDLLT